MRRLVLMFATSLALALPLAAQEDERLDDCIAADFWTEPSDALLVSVALTEAVGALYNLAERILDIPVDEENVEARRMRLDAADVVLDALAVMKLRSHVAGAGAAYLSHGHSERAKQEIAEAWRISPVESFQPEGMPDFLLSRAQVCMGWTP